MLEALPGRPLAWLSVALAVGGLIVVAVGLRQKRDGQAFLGSCAFLTGMLAATAACVFPVMLRSIDPASIRSRRTTRAFRPASLETAFTWWIVGFPLAVIYFVVLFRLHRGKAVAAEGRHGY